MYDLISFISRGKLRKRLLAKLTIPKSPTQLSEILSVQRPAISRGLAELQKKELITCLTPNEKSGRFYQITPKGLSVLEKIEEIYGDSTK